MTTNKTEYDESMVDAIDMKDRKPKSSLKITAFVGLGVTAVAAGTFAYLNGNISTITSPDVLGTASYFGLVCGALAGSLSMKYNMAIKDAKDWFAEQTESNAKLTPEELATKKEIVGANLKAMRAKAEAAEDTSKLTRAIGTVWLMGSQ